MTLFNKIEPNDYGENYKDHLLTQYKILVQSTEKVSHRRNLANNFYIGINTAIITLLGVVYQTSDLSWAIPIIYTTGILLAIIFWLLINSYKQLNSGKFKVIHKIEEKLPLSMYKYEWEVLGEGEDKSLYFPFSHVELWIPTILGILYSILLISCFSLNLDTNFFNNLSKYNLAKILNTAGLMLDFIGAILIGKYGLPEEISRAGSINLILEQVSEEEKEKAKRYDRFARFATHLLVFGFLVQLIGTLFS